MFNYILIDYDFDRYMTSKINYRGKNESFSILVIMLLQLRSIKMLRKKLSKLVFLPKRADILKIQKVNIFNIFKDQQKHHS